MISATVICDSISSVGHRITSFELRYPRMVHSEFMTHRVISRNASSSRATPVDKLIKEVRDDILRAAPVYWGAEQRGMQAGAELGPDDKLHAQWVWTMAALDAAGRAEELAKGGVHKSIVNRLLEPFSHINVVATATEWDNFFGLRLHKDAEPTMRALAEAMWAARAVSHPGVLFPGQWHLPYVTDEDLVRLQIGDKSTDEVMSGPSHPYSRSPDPEQREILTKISVARCARVSYKSFDTGKRSTIEEDLRLYDKLVGAHPIHASPAEHQATPDERMVWPIDVLSWKEGFPTLPQWQHQEQHGNFVGWRQYRKMLPGENCAPLPEGFRS